MNIIAAITGLAVLASPVLAQELGDARKGGEFAQAACYQCHAVAKGQDTSPDPKAPSFSRIAADPRMTALALHVWFQSPHPTMPNLMLGEYDKANLIAYITSLKAHPDPALPVRQ